MKSFGCFRVKAALDEGHLWAVDVLDGVPLGGGHVFLEAGQIRHSLVESFEMRVALERSVGLDDRGFDVLEQNKISYTRNIATTEIVLGTEMVGHGLHVIQEGLGH